jgi:hypothetical protein
MSTSRPKSEVEVTNAQKASDYTTVAVVVGAVTLALAVPASRAFLASLHASSTTGAVGLYAAALALVVVCYKSLMNTAEWRGGGVSGILASSEGDGFHGKEVKNLVNGYYVSAEDAPHMHTLARKYTARGHGCPEPALGIQSLRNSAGNVSVSVAHPFSAVVFSIICLVQDNFGAESRKEGGDHDALLDKRKANYMSMVNSFYTLVTDFYEYGWGDSFHFANRFIGESHKESLRRAEYFLASKLQLTEESTVLDVGCGIGGPMRAIARFSGATVTGINNCDYQVSHIPRTPLFIGLTRYGVEPNPGIRTGPSRCTAEPVPAHLLISLVSCPVVSLVRLPDQSWQPLQREVGTAEEVHLLPGRFHEPPRAGQLLRCRIRNRGNLPCTRQGGVLRAHLQRAQAWRFVRWI